MSTSYWQPDAAANRGWFALAGMGLAVGLYAIWSRERTKHRKALAERGRARIVSLEQARREADLTKQAVTYAGGVKGG